MYIKKNLYIYFKTSSFDSDATSADIDKTCNKKKLEEDWKKSLSTKWNALLLLDNL